jgi:hypothetical protein
METVWILWERYPYEGDAIRGVYATEELAEQARQKEKEQWPQDTYYCEEHDVKTRL